jgi:hypothetical protein
MSSQPQSAQFPVDIPQLGFTPDGSNTSLSDNAYPIPKVVDDIEIGDLGSKFGV